MLKNLIGIKWIGDLSLEDADVLARYAKSSKNILEFGCGGSTQILSQCSQNIISVDTDPKWIEVTEHRLTQISRRNSVKFLSYTTEFDQQFDLILVDGVDNLRRQFAIETWQYLKEGGVMLFHDTRRFQDFQNAAWIAQLHHNEISQIDINARASNDKSSNITVIHKKIYEPYVNWNHIEGKPQWSYGNLDSSHPLWTYDDKFLSQHDEHSKYSQNGEDGILEKIFQHIGVTNKIAVEFGVTAGGGGLETNTRLLSDNGWTTFWFDAEKAGNVPKNCFFKQTLLTKDNIIDEFRSQNIPEEFDLLSIDIDGNDYHLRESLSVYKPRVCVIEYNGSIPADQEYIMPYNEQYRWKTWKTDFGASLLSLELQAKELGYDLVYCETRGVNAFFIRKDINVFPVKTSQDAYKKLWWAK